MTKNNKNKFTELEQWQIQHCSTAVQFREAWTGDYSHCRIPSGETFKCGGTCPYYIQGMVE